MTISPTGYGSLSNGTPLVGSEDESVDSKVKKFVRKEIERHVTSYHPPILTAASEDSTENSTEGSTEGSTDNLGENQNSVWQWICTVVLAVFGFLKMCQSSVVSTIGGFFVNNNVIAGDRPSKSLAPSLAVLLSPFLVSYLVLNWGWNREFAMGLCAVFAFCLLAATLDKLKAGSNDNGVAINATLAVANNNSVAINNNTASINNNTASIDKLTSAINALAKAHKEHAKNSGATEDVLKLYDAARVTD